MPLNRRPPLETLWRKRLGAFVRALPGVRAGDAEALHQTRVASRRLRESLPIVAAGRRRGKLKKTQRKFRQITRELGPVRELDVAIGLLAEIERGHPAHAAAINRVRNELGREQRRLREKMLGRLDGLDVEKLSRKIAALAGVKDNPADLSRKEKSQKPDRPRKLRRPGQSEAAWRAVLAARVGRRAALLREAIEKAGAIYAPKGLHPVRVAAKKLRYALELAQEARAFPAAPPIRSLRKTQDILGRLHDLEVLADRGRAVQAAMKPTMRKASAELDALVGLLEEECRQRHATYVTRREKLLETCQTVWRDRRAQSLSVGRPRAARVVGPRRRSDARGKDSAADQARGIKGHGGRR